MYDEMDYRAEGNYRGGNNRGGNYRGDYREDYRDDYRMDYRGNYRDEYGRNQRDRRSNRMYRNNYRNYRSNDEYAMMLEEIADDGMELSRSYEEASEMAMNSSEKSKLMKMAEREKEHTKYVKEMIQNNM